MDEIGKGGYGKVFKAVDKITQIAIKKIAFIKEDKQKILREVYRFAFVHNLFN
jgi:serine/threonine protein kinase